MINKRAIYASIGFIFLFVGFSYILNSITGISGFIISEDIDQKTNGVFGLAFTVLGLFFLSKARRAKGQAALEFLVTYGWAILAAIIAIGVLAYFGVFSPSFSPAALILSPPFYGVGSSVYVDASNFDGEQPAAQIEIKNNGGTNANVKALTIKIGSNNCRYNGPSKAVNEGQTSIFILTCDNTFETEEKVSGDVTIKYTKSGSQLEMTSEGTISGSAIDAPIAPEICDNAKDDDGDGIIDCEDSSCSGISPCFLFVAEGYCTDTIDNDGNLFTDCIDPNCISLGQCGFVK